MKVEGNIINAVALDLPEQTLRGEFSYIKKGVIERKAMLKKIFRFIVSLFILSTFLPDLRAQGPSASYYYLSSTEVPWAECYAFLEGGSRQRVPFLPVVTRNFRNAPLGIGNYSHDIEVDAPLVFLANGLFKENVWNCYHGRRYNHLVGDIDVTGKAVLFCYDFPDPLEEKIKNEVPLSKRIAEAASRKAAAVIVFSSRIAHPFLYANYEKEPEIPDIPVISITKDSALSILLMDASADGKSLFEQWKATGNPPQSLELIARIRLRIKGNFEKIETKNFLVRFRQGEISREEIKKLV
jgi:hypothetical protein